MDYVIYRPSDASTLSRDWPALKILARIKNGQKNKNKDKT